MDALDYAQSYTLCWCGNERFNDDWREAVIEIADRYFESFTLVEGLGYFRERREKTLLIKIASDDESTVRVLAVELCKALKQESVGFESNGEFCKISA